MSDCKVNLSIMGDEQDFACFQREIGQITTAIQLISSEDMSDLHDDDYTLGEPQRNCDQILAWINIEPRAIPNGLAFSFTTSWPPPIDWAAHLSEAFPKLHFRIDYRDLTLGIEGYAVFANGLATEDEYFRWILAA